MDGIHHELERRINQGARLFGVKPFNQCGRAFEVSKKCSDGLALIAVETLSGKLGLFITEVFVTVVGGNRRKGING
jgi:hypothetical protein